MPGVLGSTPVTTSSSDDATFNVVLGAESAMWVTHETLLADPLRDPANQAVPHVRSAARQIKFAATALTSV